MLEFEEATHTYKLAGRIVPSVTQIINSIWPVHDAGAYYRERGNALHKAIELSDAGRLNWKTVHDEIAGKVKAWEKFRKDWPRPIIARELPIGHSVYGFAGKLDAAFDGQDKFHVIADAKSTLSPLVKLQIGGYALLWRTIHRQASIRGLAIELRNDESYRCEWMKMDDVRLYEQTFLNALGVFNFTRTHKLKGPNGTTT